MLISNEAQNYTSGQVLIKTDIDGNIVGLIDQSGRTINSPLINSNGELYNPTSNSVISTGSSSGAGAPVTGVGGDLYKGYDGSQATLSNRSVAVLGTSTTTDMLTSGLMKRAQLPAGIKKVRIINSGNGIVRGVVGVGDEPAAANILLSSSTTSGAIDISPNGAGEIELDKNYPTDTSVYVYWVAIVPNGGTLSSIIGTVSVTGIGAAQKSESQVLSEIPCPYIYIPGAALTGDPVVKSNVSGIPTTITPSGGDGNVWGTDGYAHPSSEALRFASEDARAFSDLSTLTAGVFLLSFWSRPDTLPTIANALEYHFTNSIGATSGGGWGWGHQQTNQRGALKWRTPGSGTVKTVVTASSAIVAGAMKHTLIAINTIDAVASIYIDGVLDNSAVLPAAPYPSGDSTMGVCIWGDGQASGTANQLGSKGSVWSVDRYLLVRAGDIRSKIPNIANVLFNAGHTLPVNLAGLLTP